MALWFLNDPLDCSRPSRIADQHFGMGLDAEDFTTPMVSKHFRNMFRYPGGYLRPWRSQASQRDAGSTVALNKDKFQVNLDVQQFKPEEISVKVIGDNIVTIEGKHEEKQDEHGYISRHFVRKYVLPKGHDISRIESKLSSDGVLTITAPKAASGATESRSIPITQTGQPSVSNRAGEDKETKAVEKGNECWKSYPVVVQKMDAEKEKEQEKQKPIEKKK